MKMLTVRKSMAVVLTALMLALAACSGGNAPAGEKGTVEEVSDQGDSKTFKLWLGWTATVNNDSLVQQYWRENDPGIDVRVEATQGDAVTALNLKLNTGGFEDAAVFGRSDVVNTSMIRSGSILPLEEYFNMPDKYPGLASIPKRYLDAMKDKDGHIWSIPTWFDQNPDEPWPGWASGGWFIRTDVLEKTGMKKEDLGTLEGIEKFLRLAAQQKDESGRPLLPMSFLSDANDEQVIISTFGVTTAVAGGVIPVEKNGEEYGFIYDNPQYKEAYKWMNKLYRENLIDHEVVTDKKERYKEKNKTGRVAMNVGGFFNIDHLLWEQLDGPTEPAWFYETIPYPKVDGVDNVGINQIVNPFPGDDVYISKNTKNLNAILKFLDYTLTPNAEQQHVSNDGPVGVNWDWVDEPLGKWKYINPEYQALITSGDTVKMASAASGMYYMSSYSNEWYPWWNLEVMSPKGRQKTIDFSQEIGKMGAVRVAEPQDMVKAKVGGLWEKYLPELENVRKEYKAKLLMAKTDNEFEKVWTDFQGALEKRAHWSELKKEWHETLAEETKA
jgi:putative aldouronate transport system substrate-binding protein